MNWLKCLLVTAFISGGFLSFPHAASALDYEEYPSIKLRSLDKVTARTLTFDAQVGNTIKFGDIFIKIQSCRKPPAIEKNEAAAFLQIWQVDKASKESRWIFSGWMFSSSPALSGMDHPVYDVWVIDCIGKDADAMPAPAETKPADALPDEGTVPENSVAQPDVAPEEQKPAPATEADDTTEDTTGGLPDNAADIAPVEEQKAQEQQPASPESKPADTSPAPTKNGSENIDGIY